MVVGMGSIDDYPELCMAGADEIFCGYVPGEYYRTFGKEKPLNRREVIYYNVQLGSESELKILNYMKEKFNVNIRITLNALNYNKSQRIFIIDFCKNCIKSGYKDFIVAERELAEMLAGIDDINLYISGEYGEINICAVDDLMANISSKVLKGLIFPRQTTICEMKEIIEHVKNKTGYESMAFEAFVLNEKCHFTGAYCNSLHCDELYHMCLEPYRLCDNRTGTCFDYKCEAGETSIVSAENVSIPGESGCAVCALWDLEAAGITHLKIVGRGNDSESMIRDVSFMKQALDILEENRTNREEYIIKAKKELFINGCSGNCYYYFENTAASDK